MKNLAVLGFVLLSSVPVLADCPLPMVGGERIAVRYVPVSKNYEKTMKAFEANFEGHIGYIGTQMQAGMIESAGPYYTEDGKMNGGTGIYNTTDFAKVRELVQQDPVVAKKVFKPELHKWMQCSLPVAK